MRRIISSFFGLPNLKLRLALAKVRPAQQRYGTVRNLETAVRRAWHGAASVASRDRHALDEGKGGIEPAASHNENGERSATFNRCGPGRT
jgi:hypothetical protein